MKIVGPRLPVSGVRGPLEHVVIFADKVRLVDDRSARNPREFIRQHGHRDRKSLAASPSPSAKPILFASDRHGFQLGSTAGYRESIRRQIFRLAVCRQAETAGQQGAYPLPELAIPALFVRNVCGAAILRDFRANVVTLSLYPARCAKKLEIANIEGEQNNRLERKIHRMQTGGSIRIEGIRSLVCDVGWLDRGNFELKLRKGRNCTSQQEPDNLSESAHVSIERREEPRVSLVSKASYECTRRAKLI